MIAPAGLQVVLYCVCPRNTRNVSALIPGVTMLYCYFLGFFFSFFPQAVLCENAGRCMQAVLTWTSPMPQHLHLQSSMLQWPGPFWGRTTEATSLLRLSSLMRGSARGMIMPAVGSGGLRLSNWLRSLPLGASAVHSGMPKPFFLHLHCPLHCPLPAPPPPFPSFVVPPFCPLKHGPLLNALH